MTGCSTSLRRTFLPHGSPPSPQPLFSAALKQAADALEPAPRHTAATTPGLDTRSARDPAHAAMSSARPVTAPTQSATLSDSAHHAGAAAKHDPGAIDDAPAQTRRRISEVETFPRAFAHAAGPTAAAVVLPSLATPTQSATRSTSVTHTGMLDAQTPGASEVAPPHNATTFFGPMPLSPPVRRNAARAHAAAPIALLAQRLCLSRFPSDPGASPMHPVHATPKDATTTRAESARFITRQRVVSEPLVILWRSPPRSLLSRPISQLVIILT